MRSSLTAGSSGSLREKAEGEITFSTCPGTVTFLYSRLASGTTSRSGAFLFCAVEGISSPNQGQMGEGLGVVPFHSAIRRVIFFAEQAQFVRVPDELVH